MKRLLTALAVLPLLITIVLFFTSKSFQNTIYFIGWNSHVLKISQIQEAISSNPNNLLTLKMKNPPPEHVQNIIKWIQYFQTYYKSISQLDSDIEKDLKQMGIQRPARHIASTNKFINDEYIQKLNNLKDKNTLESILSIGINREKVKNIDFNTKDYKKYLNPDFVYADFSFKIPQLKSVSTFSLLSLTQIEPNLIIETLLKNLNLDGKSLSGVRKAIAELQFSKDIIVGIPVFVIKHNKLENFLIYMTVLNKENIYLTSSKDSLVNAIDNLKSNSAKKSAIDSDFFWAQLNLEMIINTLPDNLKIFLPASTRNLKNLIVTSNLTDHFSLEGKVEFTDSKSPLEALKQLESLSKFAKRPSQNIKGIDINTDEWIKKFFSYKTDNNFIVSLLKIPLSEPRSKIENYLKQEFKSLTQDKTLITTVTKYMKMNNLVQIKLKDLDNPLSFSLQKDNNSIPFIVRQGLFLSTKQDSSNFRPYMLIAQAQCRENAKFTFQIVNKAKIKPVSMYKMFQDPNSLNSNFTVDKDIKGLQVFMIKDPEFSKEWSMEFHTENSVQLTTEEALPRKSPFFTQDEPKKIFKLNSVSPCQIPFEPILIGQAN